MSIYHIRPTALRMLSKARSPRSPPTDIYTNANIYPEQRESNLQLTALKNYLRQNGIRQKHNS